MNEPIRTQWEIRCAFNAYCKRSLMNEKLVAHSGEVKKGSRKHKETGGQIPEAYAGTRPNGEGYGTYGGKVFR